MTTLLDVESTLTDRYQTTVPASVRRALNLGKRDKIHYAILPNGAVLMTRAADTPGDDPALRPFLDLLAHDIADHPERLMALDPAWLPRLHALVGDMAVDLEAPLSADDE
jgi:antitoxin PrlF